jgi:uncharacterized protein (DUF362 family)
MSPTKIVLRYLDGRDKVTLLKDVLDTADFNRCLEEAREKSGNSKAEFRVAIKPNASMYIRRDEDGVVTDPVLVLALVERILAMGYKNVCLVESSNLYSAGFENRSPIVVMAEMGLAGGLQGHAAPSAFLEASVLNDAGAPLKYRLEDLGENRVMMDSPDMPGGKIELGRAWAEADFRMSFAKFKTHIYDGYTLLAKNTYGCLPESNKMWHYHHLTGAAKPTIAQLKLCPVHFNIIDAVTAVDGLAGVKWDRAIPRKPGFIMAGRNLGEVERAATKIMGVDYTWTYMSRPAIDMLAEPAELDGEPRPLKPWVNVPWFMFMWLPILERLYHMHRFVQMISDFHGDAYFRRKRFAMIFTVLSYLLLVTPVLYAIQKRHWVRIKLSDMRRRSSLKARDGLASPEIDAELDRMEPPELKILAAILGDGNGGDPVIYGHKVKHGDKIYSLPDSSYFRVARIPLVISMARNGATTPDRLKRCAEARIEYETAARAKIQGN